MPAKTKEEEKVEGKDESKLQLITSEQLLQLRLDNTDKKLDDMDKKLDEILELAKE